MTLQAPGDALTQPFVGIFVTEFKAECITPTIETTHVQSTSREWTKSGFFLHKWTLRGYYDDNALAPGWELITGSVTHNLSTAANMTGAAVITEKNTVLIYDASGNALIAFSAAGLWHNLGNDTIGA